ncbi:unnamed protein product [Peronospora farinosa]|nr:unnamed protein product [Peronospora farinosa]
MELSAVVNGPEACDKVDEGILSSSKRNLLTDTNGVWKDVGGDSNDMQQAVTYGYRPYVPPKQKSGNIQTAKLWVATVIRVKPDTNVEPAILTSLATTELISLQKLLRYAFEKNAYSNKQHCF